MIKKLQEMLKPRMLQSMVTGEDHPADCVIIPAEEAANIFGVLLSVANLLDSPSVKSKGELADCLSKGMERMIVATEDMVNVQKAFNNLIGEK